MAFFQRRFLTILASRPSIFQVKHTITPRLAGYCGKVLQPQHTARRFFRIAAQQCHGKEEVNLHTDLSMPKLEVSRSKVSLSVDWQDGTSNSFNSVWLRHNCHCSQCKQPHSGQNLVQIHHLTDKLALDHATIDSEKNALMIEWNNHDHEGIIPLDWLKDNNISDEKRKLDSQRRQAITYKQDGLPPASNFSEISSSKDAFWKWLLQINEFGIGLVKNVPAELGSVAKVAELIAPVMNTFYGTVFDVIAMDSPINIAYTDVELPLHMDLIYLESPPGLQLLHCVQVAADIQGGDTIFLDMFHVAEEFRRNFPEYFQTLVRVPATFQKVHYEREKPVHLTYQQPHIILNYDNEIVAVNWAPAFEGPLKVKMNDVPFYYRAYRQFSQCVAESNLIVCPCNFQNFKMLDLLKKSHQWSEGDCIVFNNHRLVHGRRAYISAKHARHLQGCYVNMDDFRSKFCVTSRLYGDGRPSRRVGNRDFF